MVKKAILVISLGLLFTVLPTGVSLSSNASAAATQPTYIAVKGDNLYRIAIRFGTTVEKLKNANNLESDLILAGQVLIIPDDSIPTPSPPSLSLQAVVAGSKLFTRAYPPTVSRGGTVRREIPSGTTASASETTGQLVDWQTVNSLFPKGGTATLQDVDTGLRFQIYRLFGTNHADCEPLTATDTAIMKKIYGGHWSWNRRAVLLLINGQVIAASMNGMPHGSEEIMDNNFPGQFCLHFLNSRTHGTNRVDPDHQAMVRKAAGL
ncbi:MAG: LysM peptidoglycan-binding domain-containing protein [Peptococcaceae bacterium]|nr:MAG: LysM peptidoglycan-binding domain-containing protein [Peptococcaceae bacterium]